MGHVGFQVILPLLRVSKIIWALRDPAIANQSYLMFGKKYSFLISVERIRGQGLPPTRVVNLGHGEISLSPGKAKTMHVVPIQSFSIYSINPCVQLQLVMYLMYICRTSSSKYVKGMNN